MKSQIQNLKNTNNIKRNSSKKKKKFKNTRLFKILRIALLIIIILFIFNIILDLFHKKNNQLILIIGDKKISLKNEMLIDEEENIYLSKDDIANLYDENIYYNSTDKKIITTYNKHIAVIEMGKSTMSVNDTITGIKGKLKEEDGILYLPFSDMDIVYDFEYDYDSENKVVIVDSLSDALSESVVLKNAKLKDSTGIFAKKLETIKKGTYVTIIEKGDKYTKVRTSSGNIGYIKTKKISEPEIKRETMASENLTNVKILTEYSIVESNYEVISDNSNDTLIVTPNLFNIDTEFNVNKVIDLEGNKFEVYKEWANQSSVNIAAEVTFDGSMNKLCSDYITRTYVINSIYTEVVKNRLNMVCINFESVDDIEGFYRFVIELTPRFKEAGIKVLVKYKDNLNKNRLNKIVDYVY